jgi:hypothetical protein
MSAQTAWVDWVRSINFPSTKFLFCGDVQRYLWVCRVNAVCGRIKFTYQWKGRLWRSK